MAENTCPLCGKKLKDGVCPDCGGSTENAPLHIEDSEKTSAYYTEKIFGKEPRSLKQLIFTKEHLWKFILAVLVPPLVFVPVYFIVVRARFAKKNTVEAREKDRVNKALWGLSFIACCVWILLGVNGYLNVLSDILRP